jgi:hypothetical protein
VSASISQEKQDIPWRKHPPLLRARVATLRAAGVSQSQVARRLNLPQGSVWHLGRQQNFTKKPACNGQTGSKTNKEKRVMAQR